MEETQVKKIPNATAKRLPLYYRNLKFLEELGTCRINSSEFSKLVQVPSATIRKDFSHFGELGRSGYGYDVSYLISVFSQTLNVKEITKLALVGAGNLGKALLKNNFRRNDNLVITCAFDNNETLSGTDVGDIPIYPMKELSQQIKKRKIGTAISTVPSKYSQKAIDMLVDSGVTAILNFAPGRVKVPKHVHVHYIDLTTELQTLVYFNENM